MTELKSVERLKELAEKVAARADADVVFYNGPIDRPYDAQFIDAVRVFKQRSNVVLILATDGGDASAAYRIARCMQRAYKRFTALIPGWCKSAGTLLIVGAHEVVITDDGEIGPLDVQLVKRDELFERRSGTTVNEALTELDSAAFETFERVMLDIRSKSGFTVTTKTAMEIAAKLTTGLYAPIYRQIDPLYIGESGRAMQIAERYGERLDSHSKNLKEGALHFMVRHYPEHGFVIDRREAEEALFNHVRDAATEEFELLRFLGRGSLIPEQGKAMVAYLSKTKKEATSDEEERKSSEADDNNGPDGEGRREETAGGTLEDLEARRERLLSLGRSS